MIIKTFIYKPESPDLADKLDKLILTNSFNRKSENKKFSQKIYVKILL